MFSRDGEPKPTPDAPLPRHRPAREEDPSGEEGVVGLSAWTPWIQPSSALSGTFSHCCATGEGSGDYIPNIFFQLFMACIHGFSAAGPWPQMSMGGFWPKIFS